MAIRHYTEEVYEQIHRTIEDIQCRDLNEPFDFIKDIYWRFAQWIGWLKIDNYKNDYQSFLNIVIDSHDATLAKVDSIFNAVEAVDFHYRDIVGGVHDSIASFRGAVNKLRDVISGKTSLENGHSVASGYIDAGKSALYSSAQTILSECEQNLLHSSGKDLIGDGLKIGSTFVKFLGACAIMDYKSAVVQVKKMADALTAGFGDLDAVFSVASIRAIDFITAKTGMNYGNFLDNRFDSLSSAERSAKNNSVSDLLESFADVVEDIVEDTPESNPYYSFLERVAGSSRAVADGAKVVSIAADTYDVIHDVSGAAKDLSSWITGKTTVKIGDIQTTFDGRFDNYLSADPAFEISYSHNTGDFLKKIISNQTGIPLSDWSKPTKQAGNIFKTLNTIWSIGKNFVPEADGSRNPNDPLSGFFDNSSIAKREKDIYDLIKDLSEQDYSYQTPATDVLDSLQPSAAKIMDLFTVPDYSPPITENRMIFDRETRTWSCVASCTPE